MRLALAVLGLALFATPVFAEEFGTGNPASGIVTAVAASPMEAPANRALLLEGAKLTAGGGVSFPGTLVWSKGAEDNGAPMLVAKGNIPGRDLGFEVLFHKNFDPSLPTKLLLEINFTAPKSFAGGSVAKLSGVLVKDQELGAGTPISGASARVVSNSFLFALSGISGGSYADPALLASRKWLELAITYANGERATIALEKDGPAQALFKDVFTAWSKTASAS